MNGQHPKLDQDYMPTIEIISPSSSPPRKKQDEFQKFMNTYDDNEVEIIDLEIEDDALIKNLLEKELKSLKLL